MKLLDFLPKEKKFNHQLEALGAHCLKICDDLYALLITHEPDQIAAIVESMRTTNITNNDTFETFTNGLCTSFITPFDREDMQSIAFALHQIPKRAWIIQGRLTLKPMPAVKADYLPIMSQVRAQAECLAHMVRDMNDRRMQAVSEQKVRIHDFENECEALIYTQLAALVERDLDPRLFSLAKDVCDHIEQLTDLFTDAADLMLRVILKHT